MTATRLIVCVVGTRPEAIKMAPVIMALRRAAWARVLVLASGQHDEMAVGALAAFGLRPDVLLSTLQRGQTLADLTARLLTGFDAVLREHRPDVVVAQGDTTTVMAAATTAFYANIPFAHVEAGLRTDDVGRPFPEEFNRRIASLTAVRHFAPTETARDNLLRERVRPETILVTGNTGIDAMQWMHKRVSKEQGRLTGLRRILLTAHRRENLGPPLVEIYTAVRRIVDAFADVEVVAPVHPNPRVGEVAAAMLAGHPRIHLAPHADYPEMVRLLASATLVLTDSGGLQEEAPALGKPVLVLRDVTERPEAVAAGAALCVGTDAGAIVREASRLLTDSHAYAAMARPVSPYGDGRAADRITASLGELLFGRTPDEAAPSHDRTSIGAMDFPRRQAGSVGRYGAQVLFDGADVGAPRAEN